MTTLGRVPHVRLYHQILYEKHLRLMFRLLDTLHVVLVTHMLYWYTITNFGDYLVLAKTVW
jgi:hypothetical protein